MAETVSTNQFRNGMHIELDGSVWRIVEFQHVKPGKGGAFVRTKLKALDSGAVVDRTFRAGEKFARVHTEVKSVQFLYDDGNEAHFMDEETFDQFGLPRADVADGEFRIDDVECAGQRAASGHDRHRRQCQAEGGKGRPVGEGPFHALAPVQNRHPGPGAGCVMVCPLQTSLQPPERQSR